MADRCRIGCYDSLIPRHLWGPHVARSFPAALVPLGCPLCAGGTAAAQRGVTTFGLQVKPVFPLDYFDPITTMEREHLTGTVELTGGYAFGMSVRVGLTNTISLETGLGQIQRRYSFSMTNDTSGYTDGSDVRYVGYEIPVTGWCTSAWARTRT